jgi:hypothetical protein
MKVYQVRYSLDEFMDGRMEEDDYLFSTLDKAFKFCESFYGKKREDFEKCGGDFYICRIEGQWHSQVWTITEEILDCILYEIETEKEETNENNLNELELVAHKLYSMCEDMDYADYEETKESEINELAMDLRAAAELGCNTLLKVLEMITKKER